MEKTNVVFKLIGWSIVAFIISNILAMLLSSYLSLSYSEIFIVSLISFMSSYILHLAREYHIKIFYFSLLTLLFLSMAVYFVTKYAFSLPDPKTHAATYIIFGTLLGIGISISFLYIFYRDEGEE